MQTPRFLHHDTSCHAPAPYRKTGQNAPAETRGARESERMEQPRHRITDWTALGIACLVLDELAFERAVFQHPHLSIFRRNATTWEVLLMLAVTTEDIGPGLYEVIESVQTRALGPSALVRFLRDRREEGSIVFTRNSLKQSKWSLSLCEDLRKELMAMIEKRR